MTARLRHLKHIALNFTRGTPGNDPVSLKRKMTASGDELPRHRKVAVRFGDDLTGLGHELVAHPQTE